MTRPAQVWTVFTLLAGSALALSGCGGDDRYDNRAAPASGMASMGAPAGAPPASAPSVQTNGTTAEVASPPAADLPKATLNPNLYVSSNYMGGSGERDRLEKLVNEGVLVDGKTVKLESFSHTYAQAFPIPTKTSLTVVAAPERTRILEEGGRTFLQVGLQASKGEAARRPALNVALVIDVSGSMQEEGKMEAAKAAAQRLVAGLAPTDIISVVKFDGQAQVVVPAQPAGRARDAKRQIEALQPGSDTNIYDGLRLGYQEARKNSAREGVSLVILLSDGNVTAGVTDTAQFQQLAAETADADIQTTSVGLGVSFNEDLMLSIAREGKGNYHFIKDSADTEKVFAKELDELTQVVARAVKLRIKLADGVGLVRVLGSDVLSADEAKAVRAEEKQIDRKVRDELGITTDRKKADEPGIKMLIPNFYRGDSHVVMLEIAVPKGRGARNIADVYLKYKDLPYRANREMHVAAGLKYTPDQSQVVASVNRHVKKNLLGFQTGEAMMQAASLLNSGQPAEAVKRLDERMVVLGVAAREWKDRDLDRDGKLLDRYKSVVAEYGRNPQMASGEYGDYLRKSLTFAGYQMTR